MIRGRVLHTPAVAAYLAGDRLIRIAVAAAAREAIPLLLPTAVLAAATSEHPDLYLQQLAARVRVLLDSAAVIVDHLVAEAPHRDQTRDGERAIRSGYLMSVLGLTLDDAQTADVALNRSAPVFTTRVGAARLAKIEPRLAFDLIG
ncbi:hypothetical protein [Nonomuraea dietziae]|uniref:Uncharacterized protein n=1 Tax=Nonomuraea dietziae TaxID=65515 RepID=A0A7W5YG68_9ACTN|nr:hypothetical protein [Nonomuraea dietziae]MBB3733808.1 hypothetical protein [Nonomuraea dietziae]